MRISNLLAATALSGLAMVVPGSAWAQVAPGSGDTPSTQEASSVDPTAQAANPDADPAVQEDQAEGDVVVTGSLIRRPNIDGPVPVTSISAAQITSTSNLSLGDTLNRLPSLRSTYGQANSTRNIGTAGLNLLDLRGLGTTRTLTLVDGQRQVTSTPGAFAVDVNTIPTDLIDRVDIVTGGSSAIYGSDAVAGVVNFVLKRDFQGLNMRVQGGVTDRGDRGSLTASAVLGHNFLDDRLNVVVAAEYAHQEQLLFNDRDEQTGAYSGVPGLFLTQQQTFPVGSGRTVEGPLGDGTPDNSFFGTNPGNKFGSISLGGTIIQACPAATGTALNTAQRAAVCTGTFGPAGTSSRLNYYYQFDPNGNLFRDVPTLDLRPIGGGIYGGQSATGVEGAMLSPGLERINTNIRLNFDVSSAFKPFLNAKYVHISNNQTSTQPTFINGTLAPTFFLDNPFLTAQARSTIQTITGTTSNTAGFTFNKFNNDIGTRAEDHKRDTYAVSGGVRGEISAAEHANYQITANYGRTDTFYATGGNVDVAKFNKAVNAVRNPAGQIVCRVNADAITTNDDPACRPLNVFGAGAPLTTPDGLNYVLYRSTRKQWATQLDVNANVTADSSGLFELPGGPIGVALGAEYRREDAYSAYDPFTTAGNTFLNSIAIFNPKAVTVKEVFAEGRLPLLADIPFIHELSLEGSGRYSDYSFFTKGVVAYNFGATYSPVRDLRFRGSYAKSVRAPTLSDLYTAQVQTFANNFVDPCSQTVINQNPNRARNCAAAGIPTTFTLPDGSVVPWTNAAGSGISGFNSGNPALNPEEGNSITIGGVFQPSFIRGLTLSVDYYDITVKQAINSLGGQAVVNQCYDDPVGLDNPFCAATFRRRSSDPFADLTFAGQSSRRFTGINDVNIPTTGPGFISAPFNFARLKTSGIDADLSYSGEITEDVKANTRLIVSWLAKRQFYTFITDPNRYTRQNGAVGDPEWRLQYTFDLKAGNFDLGYEMNFVGRQTITAYETQFSVQGRLPTNADILAQAWYPHIFYHDVNIGYQVNDKFRFFMGVDNITDQLPPYGATGTTEGQGIFSVYGRSYYAGIKTRF
jgi:outer membrane receptor protein involved in Fe transport